MGFEWSAEQKKIIESRNKSLLVSAAAGSGKTAVLVERIIQLILDEKQPKDIDTLLVVTFTNKAAAEMKERIESALASRLEQDPKNKRLKKQLALLPNAKICTIDSFCQSVLRSYYYKIDLDPGFRIAEVGELRLIQEDVMKALLEEEYETAAEPFINLTEMFSEGPEDKKLEEAIKQLFEFSESAPWPEEWLENCRRQFREKEEDFSIDKTEWGKSLLEHGRLIVECIIEELENLRKICQEAGAKGKHLVETLDEDLKSIRGLEACKTYQDWRLAVSTFTLKRKKSAPKGDEEAKSFDKIIADRRKELLDEVKSLKDYYGEDEQSVFEEIKEIAPFAEELCRLTQKFSQQYAEAKNQKRVLDFSDAEHLTLNIFLDKNKERTDVAKLYAQQFEEIFIDEYQDSNQIQEKMLQAISREAEGKPNRFMVGDVKQSIYRFRMADPEIFNEKYKTYTEEGDQYQKIELSKNFRSFPCILENINGFFMKLMTEAVGGIDYTEKNALHQGNQPEGYAPRNMQICMLESAPEKKEEAIEAEAQMIAYKIRELMGNGQQIFDKEKKIFRPIEYKDIAILLRTKKDWESIFSDVLTMNGIPSYTEGGKEYFDTWEIELLLNVFRVIDNPLQDIPLAGVLHSPIFEFSAEELAQIRVEYEPEDPKAGGNLYKALSAYEEKGSNEALRRKVEAFFVSIKKYRAYVSKNTLSEFLSYFYTDSGFYRFATAMTSGIQRKKNLDVLKKLAMEFEKTSYRGVFHFLRYIEDMRKYDVSNPEPTLAGENENVVQILSIHKSKGLEFPVVFVAGCNKKFNEADIRREVICHRDLGIGMNRVNLKERKKKKSMMKQMIAQTSRTENLGEELRVLYVAMTRARDLLFVTAAVKEIQEDIEVDYGIYWRRKDKRLPCIAINSANTYLDWILKAYRESTGVDIQYFDMEQLEEERKKQIEKQVEQMKLFQVSEAPGEVYHLLAETVDYPYLYDDLYKMKGNVSVSALKMKDYQKEETEAGEKIPLPVLINDIPGETGGITGAARGTLYHNVMEWLDTEDVSLEGIESQLAEMEKESLISSTEKSTIKSSMIKGFFDSELGKRFVISDQKGKAFREKQFIIGVPFEDYYPGTGISRNQDELLMIQGIIDLFFEEEDGIVLVDYKTDRVNSENVLLKHYRLQLEIYQRAIETITGKKVKEKWIYSFALNREILV